MILVSACLLGHKVKYNGGSNDDTLLQAYNAQGRFVAVCPECFAMLPVPRAPMEIQYGTGRKLIEGRAQAVDADGHDLTASLLLGAQKILRIAEAYHAEVAIFKEGSPSCGVHRIYDGSFSGQSIAGAGLTTEALRAAAFPVFCEEELDAVEALFVEGENGPGATR